MLSITHPVNLDSDLQDLVTVIQDAKEMTVKELRAAFTPDGLGNTIKTGAK